MHSPTAAWGLPVNNLSIAVWVSCPQLSTVGAATHPEADQAGGYPVVLRKLSEVFHSYYGQVSDRVSYLLSESFIHISTVPITKNEKKG